MTQPAKVQEPSMEEILASIRRIIADDEAKPAAGDTPQAAALAKAEGASAKTEAVPAGLKPAMNDIPPSAIAPLKPAAAKAPPAEAVSNSQDDIDAMLAGLDEMEPGVRAAAPEPAVFELTDDMAMPDSPDSSAKNPAVNPVMNAAMNAAKASFNKIEPDDDLEFMEAGTAKPVRPPLAPGSEQTSQPILSRTTVSAVESAFNSLAHTVLSNNARTLEDLVKEMLRPMLKSWLDDNLPGMVERIVKAEIERVSRGR